MSTPERIVSLLLETERACAACQQEFGIKPTPGTSHGLCRRHMIAHYQPTFTEAEAQQMTAKLPDSAFCPDLSQAQAAPSGMMTYSPR